MNGVYHPPMRKITWGCATIWVPNPLHPLLPPLASDGQVEEKPASGPRPIETVREWDHYQPPEGYKCPRGGQPIYTAPQEIPSGPCDVCGEDFISRGVVERDREDGTIYRRDGKAVPREKPA